MEDQWNILLLFPLHSNFHTDIHVTCTIRVQYSRIVIVIRNINPDPCPDFCACLVFTLLSLLFLNPYNRSQSKLTWKSNMPDKFITYLILTSLLWQCYTPGNNYHFFEQYLIMTSLLVEVLIFRVSRFYIWCRLLSELLLYSVCFSIVCNIRVIPRKCNQLVDFWMWMLLDYSRIPHISLRNFLKIKRHKYDNLEAFIFSIKFNNCIFEILLFWY